ncbi:pitrilysin family protein [Aquitalea sp. LB_tupeE]|uniref:M16 family metallopeptidase n=1 Tax=Aquitalea sp. LB_tupeE TaxID=2748078 RepID=UPI002105363A|nr:pitrilysin family protein [Aquitalea sp. LB_tupeE]
MFVLVSTLAHAVEIQSWIAPQGARVLLVETHANPILDVRVDFDAGSRRDPPGKEGLAAMVAGLLDSGTGQLDEEAIQQQLANSAAQLNGFAELETAGVRMRSLSRSDLQERVTGLATLLLTQPTFATAVLNRERQRAIESLLQKQEDAGASADITLQQRMYGDHPYARPAFTAVKSLQAIQREDLLQFWQQHYRAAGAVVSIVGDIKRQDAEKLVNVMLRNLPQSTLPLPDIAQVPPQSVAQLHLARPGSQTHIAMGMPVLRRDDPDYYPLLVGNYILGGGGFDSRLMQELRVRRGLTYGVRSHFTPLQQAGPFVISLATRNAEAGLALQTTREVLGHYIKEGPTEAELKQAKANIIGGFPLRYDSNSKLLPYLAVIGQYHLPLSYLQDYPHAVAQVSVAQIRDAWQRRIDPQQMQIVTAGATP